MYHITLYNDLTLTIHITSTNNVCFRRPGGTIWYRTLPISSCFNQAMQMHQQHSTQLEVLRAAKLAEAINQKATGVFGRGNLISLGQSWINIVWYNLISMYTCWYILISYRIECRFASGLVCCGHLWAGYLYKIVEEKNIGRKANGLTCHLKPTLDCKPCEQIGVSNRRIIFVPCSLGYVCFAFGAARQTRFQQSAEKLQVTRTMDHYSNPKLGFPEFGFLHVIKYDLQKGDSTPSIFRSDTSWFVQVELHIAVPKVTLTYNNAPPLLLCPYHSDFHVLHHKRLADFVMTNIAMVYMAHLSMVHLDLPFKNGDFHGYVCAPKSLRLSHWETKKKTFPEEDRAIYWGFLAPPLDQTHITVF